MNGYANLSLINDADEIRKTTRNVGGPPLSGRNKKSFVKMVQVNNSISAQDRQRAKSQKRGGKIHGHSDD